MGEKIKKRRKIFEVTGENDMKYRGPLSPRHFKIIGWLMLIAGQLSNIIRIYAQVTKKTGVSTEIAVAILEFVGFLALPLFVIANFAAILVDKRNYRKQLIKFGALSLIIAAVFFYVYDHILLGIFTHLGTRSEAQQLLAAIFPPLAHNGYFAFNIFIDLFLCTVLMFFLDYRPRRIFTGKKLILFRLFALLPVLYEIGSIVAKIIAGNDAITIPSFLFPFLTTKPPMTFLLFLVMVLFFKRRERKFLKNGKTLEEYEAFLQTNTNSFHFALHSAILLAAVAVLDFIIAVILTAVLSAGNVETEVTLANAGRVVEWGFGGSAMLIFIAPLMLLFSYSRTYKNGLIDLAVPVGGIAGVLVVYVEGTSQIIRAALALVSQMEGTL